jgi:hypothetical protein
MKKIRIILTAVAFVTATAGAVSSTAFKPTVDGETIFGVTAQGRCVTQADIAEGYPEPELPSGCNNSSGNQVCTAFFEEYGNLTIYSMRVSSFQCANVYVKW